MVIMKVTIKPASVLLKKNVIGDQDVFLKMLLLMGFLGLLFLSLVNYYQM